jgi:hypothetical protein
MARLKINQDINIATKPISITNKRAKDGQAADMVLLAEGCDLLRGGCEAYLKSRFHYSIVSLYSFAP